MNKEQKEFWQGKPDPEPAVPFWKLAMVALIVVAFILSAFYFLFS